MRFKTSLKVLLLAFAAGFIGSQASAQNTLSGDVYDGFGGPLLGGQVYHVSGFIHVPVGETLSVEAGAIVKFGAADFLSVAGTLVAGGAGEPAIFTSLSDDLAGGDTNNDGPSSGSPGDWLQLSFSDSADASQLVNVEIRFAGTSGFSAIQLLQADITLTGSLIEKCAGAGLALNGDSRPVVSQCAFDECTKAVVGVRLDGVPNFTHNTATDNTVGNYMELLRGLIDFDVAIFEENLINGALVCPVEVEVPLGLQLILNENVVFKFTNGAVFFTVQGTLLAQGTETNPVVLTSFADDDYAGDTNNDGPSDGGTGGRWASLQFEENADNSRLTHAVVRYAGFAFFAGIALDQADITMENCWVAGCANMGLFLSLNSFPTVADCAFDENDLPITGLNWDSVPGFTCNTAQDNITGNYMLVSGVVGGQPIISPENYPGDVVVSTGTITAMAGDRLTLLDGVIIKMPLGGFVTVAPSGAIHVLGTGQRPVVITSLEDDEIGGDTNQDGSLTMPLPGSWSQMAYNESASASTVEHLILRYGGRSFFPGFASSSPALSARAIRVEHCAGIGIEVWDLDSDLRDCVVYSCGGDGIVLRDQAFDVVGATTVNNGGVGIHALGLFTGQIRSSIAWNNAGGNMVGMSAANLFYSNGHAPLAGVNGNINSDPLFEDAFGPDLRLRSLSPSVETGDPLSSSGGPDIAGMPRFLDGDLDRIQRVDMGAHEFGHVSIAIDGDGQPGSTVTLTSAGPSGGNAWMFIGLGSGQVPISPWGTLFLDLSLPFYIVNWPSVPSVVPLSLPGNVDGLEITFQEVSFVANAGNFSNAITLKIGCPE